MNERTLVIGQDDLATILESAGRDALMDTMIERLHRAFVDAVSGGGITPARDGFQRCENGAGVLEWMPHHDSGRSVTIKIVAYTPSNPDVLGVPTILATVTRFDDVTGGLLAVSDGVLLTALRTGAASAIASRLLAGPDSRVVGLVGAGAQAVTQLHALSRVFELDSVLVHDIDSDHAESFLHRVAFIGLDARVAGVREIEESCDIICTATSVPIGGGPVLPGVAVRPHAHLNAIGSDLPGKTELPVGLLRRALVCPDHIRQARREGECQQLRDTDIGPDLLTLCAHPDLAAAHRQRLTVFDSTGFALEDHVALDIILEYAAKLDVGHRVQVEFKPANVLNPYAPRPTGRQRAEPARS